MKIAVFYHAILSGPGIPEGDLPLNILTEQLAALHGSGLVDAASEIHIGATGRNSLLVAALAPPKAIVHHHPDSLDGERPTLEILRQWLPGHAGWLVCYHHIKGVSHAGDTCAKWRRCMEAVIIWNWQACVRDLDQGFQTAGAHWLTPERHNIPNKTPYWGGNFWWARQDYLITLPPLPPASATGRYYDGEAWIGTGLTRPTARDYAPHWPMQCPNA